MAWTITQTIDKIGSMTWGGSTFEMIKVKLDCTSDASGTDTDLSSDIMQFVSNSFCWAAVCVPDAVDVPAAAFQLEIENEDDVPLVDSLAAGVSNTANTYIPGSTTLGMPPPFFDTISFVCGTLGDTKKAVFYLYFAKGM